MGGLFYNLGRRLGRAAVPALRKGRWIWDGLVGDEEDARRAERSLGAAMAVEVRAVAGVVQDEALGRLLREILGRLMAVEGGAGYVYRVETIAMESPNAMALPGGFLFVSDSLADLCRRDADELAFVLGHEMAHVRLGHAWQRMVNQGLLKAASMIAGRAGLLGLWMRQHGLKLLQSAYAREGEFAADEFGVRVATKAGFDPQGGIRLLRRLERGEDKTVLLGPYFASHPPAEERIARMTVKRT